ncbi:hypothetical protein L1887_15181 [Cichorium endivia]|nr:hypothetical protein L1887_15181 [Cichorium endivia]
MVKRKVSSQSVGENASEIVDDVPPSVEDLESGNSGDGAGTRSGLGEAVFEGMGRRGVHLIHKLFNSYHPRRSPSQTLSIVITSEVSRDDMEKANPSRRFSLGANILKS